MHDGEEEHLDASLRIMRSYVSALASLAETLVQVGSTQWLAGSASCNLPVLCCRQEARAAAEKLEGHTSRAFLRQAGALAPTAQRPGM